MRCRPLLTPPTMMLLPFLFRRRLRVPRTAVLYFVMLEFGIVTIFFLARMEIYMGYKYVLVPLFYYYTVPPKALPLQDCSATLLKVQNLRDNLQRQRNDVHSANFTNMPRVIHQSWKNHLLPERFAAWRTTWRHCYPVSKGWVHMLWTDDDNRCLVQEKMPWFLPHYDSLPGNIYRVDAVRFVYLYLFGGIYTDLDTECLRPFDHLFTKEMQLIFVGMDIHNKGEFTLGSHFLPDFTEGWVQNSFMVSRVKQHHFWLQLLYRIMRREGFGPPELLTGTGALMQVIQRYREEEQQKDVPSEVAIFPAEFFNPFSWMDNPYTQDCKDFNQMSEEDLMRCRKHFATTSYVVQYHTQTWGRGSDTTGA